MRGPVFLGWLVFGLCSGVMEVAVLSFLPHPWRAASFLLPVTVYLSLHVRPLSAFLYAAGGGIVIELFVIQHPSHAFVKLLLLVALVILAARTVLTNYSLYVSLALVLAATALDLTAEWMFGFPVTQATMAFRILWGAFVVSILFLLQARVSQRFYSFRHPGRLYET